MANKLNFLEKLCIYLGGGKNAVRTAQGLPTGKESLIGNAAIVSSTIAAAKAIFRPTFTMADKNEKPETKKYTAIREGLTEAIAIPVYILSGVCAKKLTKMLENPKYFTKMAKKQLGKVNLSDNAINEKAAQLAKELNPKIDVNLGFLGVAISALALIPAICSVAIKPLMGVIYKQPVEKSAPQSEEKHLNIEEAPVLSVKEEPEIGKTYNYYNNDGYKRLNSFPNTIANVSTMKVGGV